MIRDDDFEAWFRLLETPRLGRDSARRLLAAFGSPDAVLRAAPSALRAVVPAGAASALARMPDEVGARLAEAQRWLAGGERRQVVTLADPGYPPRLLQTADPPLLLYVDGDAGVLLVPSLAIVGSRNPTAQGADNARAFAAELSAQGLVVVSGLAHGIDGAAHEGALAGRSGTLAVLGTGPDLPYPPRHAALASRIARHGALVSEYAPGTPALAANFPLRNRIIAGLSLGTLVVEAALRSGSLITARLAAEAGREVFAIPGSIHSPQAKGCHALIKQGAKLVEVAADILEELQVTTGRTRPPATEARAPLADPLLDALGYDPASLDALIARTGTPGHELMARLIELELAGHVARLPGGLFQRRAQG